MLSHFKSLNKNEKTKQVDKEMEKFCQLNKIKELENKKYKTIDFQNDVLPSYGSKL